VSTTVLHFLCCEEHGEQFAFDAQIGHRVFTPNKMKEFKTSWAIGTRYQNPVGFLLGSIRQ
jgi:hypothetical protein